MIVSIVKKSQQLKNNAMLAMLVTTILIVTSMHGYLARENLHLKIQSEGKISSEILAAALILNDNNEIQNSIKILGQDRDICAVHVYKNTNEVLTYINFSEYTNLQNCSTSNKTDLLTRQAIIHINFKEKRYGRIEITYSTSSVWLQTTSYAAITLLTLLAFSFLLQSKKIAWKVELSNYQKTLKELIQKNSSLAERINKNIAFEIHDQIGQLISTSLIQLENLHNNKNIAECIQIIKKNLTEIHNKIRNISKELHPVIMKFGICVALEDLAETKFSYTNHQYEIIDEIHDINLPEIISINLYRISQEAYTNILKHAKATTVKTKLWVSENHLYMSIQDNGRGFNQETITKSKSLGLIGIAERATHLGGFATIESTREGTTLTIDIPNINHD